MSHTIDASVYVAALRPGDVHHAESTEYLDRYEDAGEPAIEPSLMIPECGGAVARAANDSVVGANAAASVRALINHQFEPLSLERSEQAGRLAADYRLRGADSVYVQLAIEFGTALITWDNEMLARARTVIATMTPAEWLTANP